MNPLTPAVEVRVDRVQVHDVTFPDAVRLVAAWAVDRTGGYVCTPNVDHVVRAHRDPQFRRAVMEARLRVPDGMGIVYGSRLAGRALRGTVTGRLLPEAVGKAVTEAGGSIAVVGGSQTTNERASRRLRSAGISVGVSVAPAIGFEIGSAQDEALVEELRQASPNVAFVGFGAPKQELWMAMHALDLPDTVLVGVGGAIDVLGGRVRTPPAWMTNLGLEWLFRLAQEPRRLARRYLWDDPRFFGWMLAERFSRSDR